MSEISRDITVVVDIESRGALTEVEDVAADLFYDPTPGDDSPEVALTVQLDCGVFGQSIVVNIPSAALISFVQAIA